MQWLDELEDMVFAIALAWHRLCRVCLGFGLVASLAALIPGLVSLPVLLLLSGVAVISVLAWCVAVAATMLRVYRLIPAA